MMTHDERRRQVRDDDRAGLCGRCTHVQRVPSHRGVVFYLCGRAATDPRYPRYPALPMLACPGYERAESQQPG